MTDLRRAFNEVKAHWTPWAVTEAGQSWSPRWIELARDDSQERYYQQRIRLIFDSHLIEKCEFLQPVFQVFMLAFPDQCERVFGTF